jgi:MFS family permease
MIFIDSENSNDYLPPETMMRLQRRQVAPASTRETGTSAYPRTASSGQPVVASVDPSLRRARLVLMSAFAANGLLLSTWFSRLPSVAHRLRIAPDELGMVTITLTLSTLIATPIAARRLPEWRATRIVRVTAPLTAIAMLVAVTSTQVWQLAASLLLLGSMNAIQGVGLNAHGTTLSRLANRTWMPSMIGAASAAGVLGSAAGTIALSAGVPLLLHLGVVAALCLITGVAAGRHVPIGGGTSSMRIVTAAARDTAHRIEARRRTTSASQFNRVRSYKRTERDERTGRTYRRPADLLRERMAAQRQHANASDPVIRLLTGAALGATLAEGALANFGIVLFRDVLGAPIQVAALALTVFSVAMAVIRLVGGWATDKIGPWTIMSLGGLLATVCGLTLVLKPALPIAFAALVGVAVGIGCAVPVSFQLATSHARTVAISNGADEERAAAGALSKLGLATAGGFLSGGPVVGLAASLVGLRTAVLIVAIGGAALAGCTAVVSRREPMDPTPERRDQGRLSSGRFSSIQPDSLTVELSQGVMTRSRPLCRSMVPSAVGGDGNTPSSGNP